MKARDVSRSNDTAGMDAPRITEREGGVTAFMCYLIGIALVIGGLLAHWLLLPLGALFLVLGDRSRRAHCFCGECGNDVSPKSRRCPSCGYTLYKAPMSTARFLVLLGWFVTISLIVIGALWIMQHQPR